MLKSLELGGVPATVQVYKMYNVPKTNFPSCAAEGRAMKLRFLSDILKGTGKFKKTKGDGSHPMGYVIHLHFSTPEGQDCDLFGVSVKSVSDLWCSKKGLRFAWDDLKESLKLFPNFRLGHEDYQKLMEHIGI